MRAPAARTEGRPWAPFGTEADPLWPLTAGEVAELPEGTVVEHLTRTVLLAGVDPLPTPDPDGALAVRESTVARAST